MCFYRDLLCTQEKSVRDSAFSPKRTFDLCLFSEAVIIIIEAKAHQLFSVEQAGHFSRDREQIQKLIGRPIDVRLVALGCCRDLNERVWQNRGDALTPFDGYITWAQINERYPDPMFKRADALRGG